MPTLSLFNGIMIKMNKEGGAQHHKPHLHAVCAEYEAPFDIETGDMLGSNPQFPSDKAALVKAWIILHREDLMANWKLLSDEGQFFKIEPLR